LEGENESEDELLSFVREAITSVCALELLILLRREPNRGWGLQALVRELRSSSIAVAGALDHLGRWGLVMEARDGFRYQPPSTRLDDLCQRLERQYAAKPISVIRAILEAPSDKLRIFADAFRLSGKPK